MHRRKIDPVEHFAALFVLKDKSGIYERRQMVCKRRRSEPKVVADVTDPKAFVACLHQKAKDRQTGIVAKCGKGAGVGAGHCHAVKITTILVL